MSFDLAVRMLPTLYKTEASQKKVKNYFGKHDFNQDDRAALVNWILTIVCRYNISVEAFYLTVALFDRFMSCKHTLRVSYPMLQCIGTSCLQVSFDALYKGKMVEAMEELSYQASIANSEFSSAETVEEYRLLIKSHFDGRTLIVTPYTFLAYFFTILQLKPQHDLYNVSSYLLELSQYSDAMCVTHPYHPSIMAAAALLAGITTLNLSEVWYTDFTILTGYSGEEEDLRYIHAQMLSLAKIAPRAIGFQSTYTRFSSPCNNYVAQIDYSSSQ